MKKVKIGLLPLYIKLYDDYTPKTHEGMVKYYNDIATSFCNHDVELVTVDICRIRSEFETAVKKFEDESVDAMVTVNLAYSPSLESAEVLAKTKLPMIVLDTTRDYCFDLEIAAGSTTFNHGIHGVQDLCNLMRRLGKDYSIFTGHYLESDVVKDVIDAVRAIKAARAFDGIRVGTVGGAFDGMGDFKVPKDVADKLGVVTVVCEGDELEAIKSEITDEAIKAEYERDCKESRGENVPFDQYVNPERTALAVREWIKRKELSAFTLNFLKADKMPGFDIMPFSEACKQMAEGVGYAGEGDVINAALVGSLMQGFDEVNFVEMFCPDWKNNTIYMSHMGECNLALMEGKHLEIKPFPYADSDNPVCILGNMKPGAGCIVNMPPSADGWFDMVIVEGEMQQLPDKIENFKMSINGWFKPKMEVAPMLKKYSELGGTHHSAFVYGVSGESLAELAKTLGMKCTVI